MATQIILSALGDARTALLLGEVASAVRALTAAFVQLWTLYPDLFACFLACFFVLILQRLPLILFKVSLILKSLVYMAVSKDGKFKNLPEAVSSVEENGGGEVVLREIELVFVRHGESEWNLVFNKKPKLLAPFRLVLALLRETGLFCSRDSLFFDSPLNAEGSGILKILISHNIKKLKN